VVSAPLHNRLLQNVAGLLGGRVVSLMLSAASSVLLVRYLGSLDLGPLAALLRNISRYSDGWVRRDWINIDARGARRGGCGSILMTGAFMGLIFCGLASVAAFLLAPVAGYTGELRWLLVLVAIDAFNSYPRKISWDGVPSGPSPVVWRPASACFRQVCWLVIMVVWPY